MGTTRSCSELQDVNWGEIDYLVVDAPPGTSDEHISIAQYLKASHVDGAVIVTTPQEVSLIDVRKEINFCKKVRYGRLQCGIYYSCAAKKNAVCQGHVRRQHI